MAHRRRALIGTLAALGMLAALPPAASDPHVPQNPHMPGAPSSPYAAIAGREIKALPADERADLEAGRGMGLALAAELNRHPGPRHVLDLADALGLTADQRRATADLIAPMTAQAQALGRRIVAAEAALDRDFAEGRMDAAALRHALGEIGQLRAELRFVHLETHLRQRALMTEAQITDYARLRGYAGGATDGGGSPAHHHPRRH
jgi:hypothetical protein